MSGSNVDLISPSNTKQYAPEDKVFLLVATKTVDWDCEEELFDVAVLDKIYGRTHEAKTEGDGPWARVDGHEGLVGIKTFVVMYKHLTPQQKEMLESGKYPVHYVNH